MKKRSAKLAVIAVFVGLALIGLKSSFWAQTVLAKPVFMDRYNRDPFAKDEFKTKCTICHIERGGGKRTDFGDAFEDAGYRLTPKLRAKFPQFFNLTETTQGKPDAAPTPSPSPNLE